MPRLPAIGASGGARKEGMNVGTAGIKVPVAMEMLSLDQLEFSRREPVVMIVRATVRSAIGMIAAVAVLSLLATTANAVTISSGWTGTNLSVQECMARTWNGLEQNGLGPAERIADLSTSPDWYTNGSDSTYVVQIGCGMSHHIVVVAVAGPDGPGVNNLYKRLLALFQNT